MVQNLHSQLCVPNFWDFTTRLLEPCTQLTKPMDCASTGLYPSELHYHTLWWERTDWLKLDESQWSCQPHALVHYVPQEEKTMSLHVWTESKPPVIPFTQYTQSSLTWPMLPPGFSGSSTTVKPEEIGSSHVMWPCRFSFMVVPNSKCMVK